MKCSFVLDLSDLGLGYEYCSDPVAMTVGGNPFCSSHGRPIEVIEDYPETIGL